MASTIIALVLLCLIVTGLVLVIRLVGIDAILLWLAGGDRWYSPYRNMPSGGYIVFYTKGWDTGGDYGSMLHGHIPLWHYHSGDKRFYRETDKRFKKKFPAGPPKPTTAWEERLDRLGIGRVRFFRRRYCRKREWKAFDLMPAKTGEEPKYGLVGKKTKDGEEHVFYFSTSMGIGLDNVPVKEMGSADGSIIFNALLIDPVKAEFGAGKWETRIASAVRTRGREFFARKTLDELREERDTKRRDDFPDYILLANEKQRSETGTVGLIDQYGVAVEGPTLEDFRYDEGAGAKEIVDARREEEVSVINIRTERNRAKQAEVRGRGKANERKKEAEGIKETVEAWGKHKVGGTVVMAEAIRNGSLRAFGGNIMASVDASGDDEDSGKKDKKKDQGDKKDEGGKK